MPSEQDVLTAIRALDARAPRSEISYTKVAADLGCAADTPTFQRYLARAATTGLIKSISEVDQLEAPVLFRLSR
jgi:hypothetical protein